MADYRIIAASLVAIVAASVTGCGDREAEREAPTHVFPPIPKTADAGAPPAEQPPAVAGPTPLIPASAGTVRERAEAAWKAIASIERSPNIVARIDEIEAQLTLARQYAASGLAEKADEAFAKVIEAGEAMRRSVGERAAAEALRGQIDTFKAAVEAGPEYYRSRGLARVAEIEKPGADAFAAGEFAKAAEEWARATIAMKEVRTEFDAVVARHAELMAQYAAARPVAGAEPVKREFMFDDELRTMPTLAWSGKWSFTENGAHLGRQPDSWLRTREGLVGDFDIDARFWIGQAAYSNTGGTYVNICGEGFVVTNGWGATDTQVIVRRRGNELTFVHSGKEDKRSVKPEHADKPAMFELRWRSRDTHMKWLRYTADSVSPPPGFVTAER